MEKLRFYQIWLSVNLAYLGCEELYKDEVLCSMQVFLHSVGLWHAPMQVGNTGGATCAVVGSLFTYPNDTLSLFLSSIFFPSPLLFSSSSPTTPFPSSSLSQRRLFPLPLFLSSPARPSGHTVPPALRRVRHRLNHHHRHAQALNPCNALALQCLLQSLCLPLNLYFNNAATIDATLKPYSLPSDSAKKKRGQPRKYSPDCNIALGLKMGLHLYGAPTAPIVALSATSLSPSPRPWPMASPEKIVFDLKLEKYDAAVKIKITKEVRAFTDLRLKEANDLVEKVPCALKKAITKDEANPIMEKLKELGTTVVLE
ncbi:hypothetical protein Fmac_011124 [Flemingia macrophylla]|uniref:Large ribosomal subunit protein bL12 C-terminal domain-containing protein n=1 Tax=Flemingia macrophylla TaxID=520843 RepID=A0ABD1MMD3_9FABA